MVTVNKDSDPGTFQPEWQLTGVDKGEAVRVPQFADKSYGMWGIWGGGTIILEGSWEKGSNPNDASFIALYESDNTTAISNTANTGGVVLENPIWIRPRCTVAVTNVKVVLNCTLSAGAK